MRFSLLFTIVTIIPVSAVAQEPKFPPVHDPAVNPLISRIAFGSCSNQDDPMPILRTVLEWEPDLFVYLGDNIYGDTRDMQLLEAKSAKLGAKKDFQTLRAAIPTIATSDDHDFGDIDWSGNPSVQLRIHDMTGRGRVRKSVRLNELQF